MTGLLQMSSKLATLSLVLATLIMDDHHDQARGIVANGTWPQSTDSGFHTDRSRAACPVTPYPAGERASTYTQTWYVEGDLKAGLDPAFFGQRFAGRAGVKVQWHPPGSNPTVEGRRLDAPAPPLATGSPPGNEGETLPREIRFPTDGCWEVVGRGGGEELRFVVWVHPAADHPIQGDRAVGGLAEDDWEALRRPLGTPALAADGTCPRTRPTPGTRVDGTALRSGPIWVDDVATADADGLVRELAPGSPRATPRFPTRWLADPAYQGPILVRGHSLADSAEVGFGNGSELRLEGGQPGAAPDWRVWSAETTVPGPGCFCRPGRRHGLQQRDRLRGSPLRDRPTRFRWHSCSPNAAGERTPAAILSADVPAAADGRLGRSSGGVRRSVRRRIG